jgi:hypothetical protein
MSKYVTPSIAETAFNCPTCGAYTTQYWFDLFAAELDENKTPHQLNPKIIETMEKHQDIPFEQKKSVINRFKKLIAGGMILRELNDSKYSRYQVENLSVSRCYNCPELAVWVGKNLIFPPKKSGPSPNPDLSEEIIRDYEEARSVLNLSPRGAAALLRLCVQKLCIFLGGKGENLNEDIADLVSKGLSTVVQQSLDIVRVIGNEAVHPGAIDLKDDHETAAQLFEIVNAIADQMISQPKRIHKMYEKLPANKRSAIAARDGKSK